MSTIPSTTRVLRKPAEERARPRSLYGAPVETLVPAKPERTSESPSRLPVKPTTRSSSTARQSTARPPSSTGSANGNGSMRPPTSRVSVGGKPATGGLQRSASNRRSNAPAVEIDPVKKDRSRPPITTSRHLRNPSSNTFSAAPRDPNQARTRSASTHSTTSILRPPTRGSTDDAKPTISVAETHLKKPAFSTLQQHFSPAKSLAPKPHPAAFLAPPSPSKLPSNIAISAETAKLQNELLQLHILHRDADQVDREWRASAKRKLGDRFHTVVEKNDELVQLEIQETGKINAAALKKWQDIGAPGLGLEEKIQVLDEVLTGVWNLGDSGGKYPRIIRKFERWLKRCQEITHAREHNSGLQEDEVVFLEELDQPWKEDCHALSRKLETWRSNLVDLGSPEDSSSLGIVVGSTRKLVNGMLAELGIMAQIERDALALELDWIKKMNEEVSDDDDTPVAGAIWRSR